MHEKIQFQVVWWNERFVKKWFGGEKGLQGSKWSERFCKDLSGLVE